MASRYQNAKRAGRRDYIPGEHPRDSCKYKDQTLRGYYLEGWKQAHKEYKEAQTELQIEQDFFSGNYINCPMSDTSHEVVECRGTKKICNPNSMDDCPILFWIKLREESGF